MANQNVSGISRRRLMHLGSASISAAVLGTVLATTADAQPAGVGGDGAPADDTEFGRNFDKSSASALVASETSYNGWPVGTPGSAIGVQTYIVPGTSIAIPLKSGDIATVLIYFADRFNKEVQPLLPWQEEGYSYRRNVNNPSVWSNHASGTAIDLNFELHPNTAKGTFSATEVAAIRRILAYCGDVIYWGGDYSRTTDEMHFEINVPPGDLRLTALAAKIRTGATPSAVVSLRALADNRYVTAESAGSAALIANRTVIGRWEQFDLIPLGGDRFALRAHANNRYVCAERAGSMPLIANRSAVGPWETFTVINNSDRTVSLRALVNGRYVTAERRGLDALIANRSVLGPWEKFDLIGG